MTAGMSPSSFVKSMLCLSILSSAAFVREAVGGDRLDELIAEILRSDHSAEMEARPEAIAVARRLARPVAPWLRAWDRRVAEILEGGDWRAAAWGVVSLLLAMVVYYPFARAAERRRFFHRRFARDA